MRLNMRVAKEKLALISADLSKQIADQQRWTITGMFASIVAL
jgi:hypothetical protein